MLWCLLFIVIGGVVAIKDLSKVIDGYIHSKGSDQVKELTDDFISWHIIGILWASLILFFTL